MSADLLLRVRDLVVEFRTEAGVVRTVDWVDLEVGAGETLGVVGESGSGKTVTMLAAMGLLPPPYCTVTGQVLLDGRDLLTMDARELRAVRGREIGMVFQDPMTSLHPSTRHPHQWSGGMRQRAMIAMAIANGPRLLVADEPTTALDVTIPAQILDVLRTARDDVGAAAVLITHDLGVVAEMADRVTVMQSGKVVESATRPGGLRLAPPSAHDHPPGDPAAAGPRAARPCRRATGPTRPAGREPGHALPQPGPGTRPRGRRRQPGRAPWRDPGAGGGVGMWQVHPRAEHPASGRPAVRPGGLRRDGHHHPWGSRVATGPLGAVDGLPGPVRVAEPADDRRGDRGAAASDRAHLSQGRWTATGGRAPRPGEPGPPNGRPAPGAVLRWAAPTHRHRARTRAVAGGCSSSTSRCRAWTSPSSPRSSVCSTDSSASSGSPTPSSPTTSPWCAS